MFPHSSFMQYFSDPTCYYLQFFSLTTVVSSKIQNGANQRVQLTDRHHISYRSQTYVCLEALALVQFKAGIPEFVQLASAPNRVKRWPSQHRSTSFLDHYTSPKSLQLDKLYKLTDIIPTPHNHPMHLSSHLVGDSEQKSTDNCCYMDTVLYLQYNIEGYEIL